MSTFAKTATVIGLLMGVLALLGGGVAAGFVPLGRITGDRIGPVVENWLGDQTDAAFVVKCDDTWKQKGRISDCLATRGDGVQGKVFIEQIDLSGHFRMQVTTSALIAPSPDPSPASAPAPSAEASFGEACLGFGVSSAQCACLYGQLITHGTDYDVLRAASGYRDGDGLPDDLDYAADACRRGA